MAPWGEVVKEERLAPSPTHDGMPLGTSGGGPDLSGTESMQTPWWDRNWAGGFVQDLAIGWLGFREWRQKGFGGVVVHGKKVADTGLEPVTFWL